VSARFSDFLDFKPRQLNIKGEGNFFFLPSSLSILHHFSIQFLFYAHFIFPPPPFTVYNMLPKLFLLAATALLSINAQTTPAPAAAAAGAPFAFKETYPSGGSKPTPKPEWMALIKSANITNAPVVKASANGKLDFAKSEWAMIGSSDSPFLIRSRSIWQC
jgi:hypothetical protein